MKYSKCDRCGVLVTIDESEEVWVAAYGVKDGKITDEITDATYPNPERGRTTKKPIHPATVDLCGPCRRDLHDFFRNVLVVGRGPGR